MQNLIKTGTQFIFLFALFGALAVSASAVTFTVNSTANTSDATTADNLCDVDLSTNGDQCTLRAAIQQANATAGMDTIVFDATLFASAQTILLSSRLPIITEDLTIIGIGSTLVIVDGDGENRIFNIAAGATVSISNLTATNGWAGEADGAGILNAGNLTLNGVVVSNNQVSFGSGGGIFNTGTLMMTNSVVSGNNVAGFDGGGISNQGMLTITSSQISDNQVAGDFGGGLGGGISNGEGGTTDITNTTVSGNTAGNGGGIFTGGGTFTATTSSISGNTADGGDGGGILADGSTVMLTRSTVNGNGALNGAGIYNANGSMTLDTGTISGNTAGGIGGGYYGFADLSLTTLSATASTIASNTATNGGGIAVTAAVGSSSANLSNTIVGDNTASSGPDIYSVGAALAEKSGSGKNAVSANLGIASAIFSSGFNLIENTSGGTFLPMTTDKIGVDPGLQPLAANGGATLTHGLNGSSPAIDQGNSGGTDQRGVARPIDNPSVAPPLGGNNADIGAFEATVVPSAASVNIGGRVVTSAGRGLGSARVVLTAADGTIRQAITNSFGYYRFADVAAGQTATLQVFSKRYGFLPQIVNVSEEINALNFVAQP